jgi:signal transduction histidine kinase
MHPIATLPEPTAPVSERRYQPDDLLVELADFGQLDRARLRSVYEFAQGTYLDWLASENRDAAAAMDRIRSTDLHALRAETDRLGDDTDDTPRLRAIIHDIRGGTTAAFMSLAELLLDQEVPEERQLSYLQQLVWLVRDEAKVMRGVIVDLDPSMREPDTEHKPHSVDDLVRKWDGMRYDSGAGMVSLEVRNGLGSGALANRCLEAAAIDRVAYNFLNNAARFAASDRVTIDLRRVREQPMGRVTVVNDLPADETAWLKARLASDPVALFRPDVSRGGSGVGLGACAEIVGAAFELTPDQAIRERVIGYEVVDGRFYAWFCWPTAEVGSAA